MLLPRISTVARILRDDATLAHKVAWDVCYQQCIHWCQVARFGDAERSRACLAQMLGNLNAAEYTARVSRAAVRRVWDDTRDCCDPSDVGRIVLGDYIPAGVLDVCGAAGLVAASVTALVEPEDDYGAVIAEWYRDLIAREWTGRHAPLDLQWRLQGGAARADITDAMHSAPRSLLAWMAENEARWPVDTDFRRRLDAILGEAMCGREAS